MKRTIIAAALAALPFAVAAVETDTEVVEFYNRVTNHYFVTATAGDAKFIDDGNAGAGWVRTGRSFSAWIDSAKAGGGTATVYRFYSAQANSHFYTANESEIELLKGLEAAERAAAARTGAPIMGWQLEGKAFSIQSPVNGACAAGTTAIQRVFNNGFATGEGSNHRFVDDSALKLLMEDRAWVSEGVAFCAQSKSSGTNAGTTPTTTNFAPVAADWSGDARWKKETAGAETKVTAPLSLSITDAGAVSGSGRGCSFTGKLTSGDGFRSLFAGTISATGCTDAAFNGDYSRFQLERYTDATLAVRLKRGDGANEASVEAVLRSAAAPTPPPVTPATTPASAGIVGDWIGTIAWSAEKKSGGVTTPLVSANKELKLKITDAGALTGSGFGCAFAGTLAATAKAGVFSGPVTAAGCTESVFNGTYAQAKVAKDDGRLEVEFEGESETGGVTTKVEIDGNLADASAAPATGTGTGTGTGTTPPAGITGSFAGTFAATIETRDRSNGGDVRKTTNLSDKLSLTVATGGALTGTGFGCSIAGTLTLADAATQLFKGTLTATGCTNAALNGSYAASAHPEDGGKLEVEMERESETSTLKTKVTIKGTASRA